ncbi:MAG: DUF177 domain-containing protein [Sideroxydans sp.]
MFPRPSIDSLEFARDGLRLSGDIPVGHLSRLADLLEKPLGNLSFSLQGQASKDGDFLLLSVEGLLYLRCQRCLGELAQSVSLASKLKLVAAGLLDTVEEADDTDCIEATRHMDVWTLVEDEVLLNLPFSPKHDDETCRPLESETKSAVRPFAGLASLKK